jgi:nicotinic acid mononucleotide adenylyltransferase
MYDQLKAHVAHAENTANNLEIDQIAFLIGGFPPHHRVRTVVADCPRIAALLPEIEPCPSELFALMRASDFMHREDIVGKVADCIRRVVRG